MTSDDRSDLGFGSLKPAGGIAGVKREYRLAPTEGPTKGATHVFDHGDLSIVTAEAS